MYESLSDLNSQQKVRSREAMLPIRTAPPGQILRTVRLLACLVLAQASTETIANSEILTDALTVSRIQTHLSAFQAAADANGGNRASGLSGYDASADYVVSQLTNAGYVVEQINYDFLFFEETGPSSFSQATPAPTTYTPITEYNVLGFSGSGSTGTVDIVGIDLALATPESSDSGCEANDFQAPVPSVAGKIALLQRGSCTLNVKATNAEAAGAAGVVIFNQGTPGREGVLSGTLTTPGVTIPVIGTSFAIGQDLATAPGGATGSITVSAISEIRTTSNVIAQTAAGNPDGVVMAGAHLDSVPEGPGIQDNGSGSATLLEIALQLASRFDVNDPNSQTLTSAVRFAWWGGYELGLLGSTNYVDGLSGLELAQIAYYLDFHMLGSPNFVRFVYDADGSDTTPTIPVPAASVAVEQVFLDYFALQGLATDPEPFGPRSDYYPFCDAGIACGGLFGGAEVLKTPEQAAIYGGVAGEQYDQCFHLACDTIANVSTLGLDQMSDAAAYAIAVLAGLRPPPVAEPIPVPALVGWPLALLGALLMAIVRRRNR